MTRHWHKIRSIVLPYLAFGGLWILLSDALLAAVVGDGHVFREMQTYKGWFFILFTSVLLGLLVLRQAKREEQLRRKAHHVHQQLDGLIDALTHELRRPLLNLSGHAAELIMALRDTRPVDDDTTLHLVQLKKALRETQSIQDGLLRLSRLSLEPPNPQTVDLRAILADMAIQVQAIYPHLQVQGQLLPKVHADPKHVSSILWTFAENSALWGKNAEGLAVLLIRTTEHDGNLVCVQCSDQGPGVSESHTPRLFHPFYSPLDETTRGAHLGLGLPIARVHARQNGGDLRLAPVQNSTGLSLELWLPMA